MYMHFVYIMKIVNYTCIFYAHYNINNYSLIKNIMTAKFGLCKILHLILF